MREKSSHLLHSRLLQKIFLVTALFFFGSSYQQEAKCVCELSPVTVKNRCIGVKCVLDDEC
jgi:hypothetical protein